MSTATPRLQLTKALGSESMKLGATQISDAYSKIDAAIGVKKFATQGAATAVFNGDLISETSTGQSKLFNNPNWMNIWDKNNCKGNPEEIESGGNGAIVVSGFPEQLIQTCILPVEAARKYFVNVNFSLSAQNDGPVLFGYVRLVFKYTTDLNPLTVPNIVIHDVASCINVSSSARSKSFKCIFEFFPNVTQNINFGLFGQIITGDQDAELNLNGSTPSIYMMDWGV